MNHGYRATENTNLLNLVNCDKVVGISPTKPLPERSIFSVLWNDITISETIFWHKSKKKGSGDYLPRLSAKSENSGGIDPTSSLVLRFNSSTYRSESQIIVGKTLLVYHSHTCLEVNQPWEVIQFSPSVAKNSTANEYRCSISILL